MAVDDDKKSKSDPPPERDADSDPPSDPKAESSSESDPPPKPDKSAKGSKASASKPAKKKAAKKASGAEKADTVERAASAGADKPAATRTAPRGMPIWVVPAYVAGLVLVYLGERVVEATPTAHWALSGLGVLAVVVATVARFNPNWRVGGDRKEIENVLAILSVVGVVALLIYAATTEWGAEKLGLIDKPRETQENIESILTIVWTALIALSAVPMLFAEAALLPMRFSERPESRRVRAAAASGMTISLAAVYGGLFVYTADAADIKADYSYFKTSRPKRLDAPRRRRPHRAGEGHGVLSAGQRGEGRGRALPQGPRVEPAEDRSRGPGPPARAQARSRPARHPGRRGGAFEGRGA